MRAIITAAVTAATWAAAYGLPGDVVVLSDKEVRPDEAAGLYYLGQAGGGYLYNGSSAAVGAVAPYRILDRDAQLKDYYVVWAPDWVGITPEAFAHLGAAVRLSENEILVGLERGLGPGALRAVEHRIELRKLAPVTPIDFEIDAEQPPTKKDPHIEAAVSSITAEEYAGYIENLQYFETRWTDTRGSDAARDYLRGFFASCGAAASLFPFKAVEFYGGAHYPEPGKKMYVQTDHGSFKRSADNGATWDTIYPKDVNPASSFWLDADTGFVPGYYGNMAKTADGGDTWEVVAIRSESPEQKDYKPWAICFVTANVGWLGGESSGGGFILKTVDGGETWVEQNVPAAFAATAMDFFDASRGWAAGGIFGSGRGVLYTDDGGTTWRECSMPATLRMRDLAAVGPTEAWATTLDSGQILHTNDGVTWGYVDPGIPGAYAGLEFPDSSHGYAAGVGTIIKTDNGGVTWREITAAPSITCDVFAFADKDHGIIGDGEAEHLYRTDDGGASFVSVIENVDLAAENVIGERRGRTAPEEIVIIGGHFDSHSFVNPMYAAPGAEDNGSGTACAMAAARAFRDFPFNRTVRYVAFGAEESGLLGSGAYAKDCAARGEKIVAVLNADMVCYDEDAGARDDFVAGSGENGRWMFAYLTAVGGLYGQRVIYEDMGHTVSDDRSFEAVGYPALGVIEGGVGAGGFMEYPWYHTPEDTFDKLHPALGVRFVRDYAATFAHLAGFDDVGVNDPRPAAAVPFSRAFAVYPNPYCFASAAGGVNFVGLKSPAKVEIYDLAGRRVASATVAPQTDEFVWRPGGGALSPGVYLYWVQGDEQEETGKVVITK